MHQTENFASAVMMRLVAAGLEKQGLVPLHPRPSGCHVPRATKRDILHHLEEQHGAMAVLALSDAVPDRPDVPVVRALRLATTLPDLLARWHCVEVFSHGSNRFRSRQPQTDSTHLQHIGLSAPRRPTPSPKVASGGDSDEVPSA